MPIITFNDTVTFYLNNEEVYTFHAAPAHTDGDSIIHFKDANVIHTGDIYVNGSYPFIDLDSEGSITGIITAVEELLSWTDEQTKIIPGHGELSNRAELVTYHDVLVAVRDQRKLALRDRVAQAIAKGISVEDFIASNPTADLDETWGNGFLSPEQFLRIVYADLSRQKLSSSYCKFKLRKS